MIASMSFMPACVHNETSVIQSETNRIGISQIDNIDHREEAAKRGMMYVDYLHMVNTGKTDFNESSITFHH